METTFLRMSQDGFAEPGRSFGAVSVYSGYRGVIVGGCIEAAAIIDGGIADLQPRAFRACSSWPCQPGVRGKFVPIHDLVILFTENDGGSRSATEGGYA
ncbi:hypothetical protein [Acidisphaera sp. S103]|uniref:hypothetical protein n=1 Tax=Acidisphaera sp. S103 TaxID=1747223 RepID=UPI0020B16ACF|nr:hypothetical protein [Acidisphaera sp. S103]